MKRVSEKGLDFLTFSVYNALTEEVESWYIEFHYLLFLVYWRIWKMIKHQGRAYICLSWPLAIPCFYTEPPIGDAKVLIIIGTRMVFWRFNIIFNLKFLVISDLIANFARSYQSFVYFLFCSTKISEISDMAKPWATFCCSGS